MKEGNNNREPWENAAIVIILILLFGWFARVSWGDSDGIPHRDRTIEYNWETAKWPKIVPAHH